MLILTGNRESWSMHYLVNFSICTDICVIFKLENRKNCVIQRKALITNTDIKFDSNRNINQAEIYHKKSTRFWSPVILPKRMVPLKYITWRAQVSKKKHCWQAKNACRKTRWWNTGYCSFEEWMLLSEVITCLLKAVMMKLKQLQQAR